MTALRCPACGKGGVETGACPRCGSALGELRDILDAERAHRAAAAGALGRGDAPAALRHARAAWSLRKDPETARTACAAAALCGLDREASLWFSRSSTRLRPPQ